MACVLGATRVPKRVGCRRHAGAVATNVNILGVYEVVSSFCDSNYVELRDRMSIVFLKFYVIFIKIVQIFYIYILH